MYKVIRALKIEHETVSNIDGGMEIERRAIPSSKLYVGVVSDIKKTPFSKVNKVFDTYFDRDYYFKNTANKIGLHRTDLSVISPFTQTIPEYNEETIIEPIINIKQVKIDKPNANKANIIQPIQPNPVALNSDVTESKYSLITSVIDFKQIV